MMMLRRRTSNAYCTTILPINSTNHLHLPSQTKEEVYNQREPSNNTNEPLIKKDGEESSKIQSKGRIFSITTSIILFGTIATLIGLFCSGISNHKPATLLVSAQHSNSLSTINNNHHQLNSRTQIQATIKPNAVKGIHEQIVDSNQKVRDHDGQQRNSKYNSIDRFDSGEQIRPPLLRQPTTLPSLVAKQQQQSQVPSSSIINNSNLQTAATAQDSYLSPEDREQFLRSQENHYEGRGEQQQNNMDAAPSSYNGPAERGDNYQQRRQQQPQRWSQVDPSTIRDVVSAKSSNNHRQGTSLTTPQTTPEAEDGDYDDENPEPEGKSANLVPENRRLASTSSNYKQQHQQRNFNNQQQQQKPNNELLLNEESDPSDDYNNANDEVHFSRKQNLQQNSQRNNNNNYVKPSASAYNKHYKTKGLLNNNNNNQYKNYDNNPNYEQGGTRDNQQDGESSSGAGFGYGPNDSYMADRAESAPGKGNSNLDQDDDPSLYSNGNGDGDMSSLVNDDEKLDRRSTNDQSRLAASELPQASLANRYNDRQAILNNNNNNVVDNGGADDNESDDSNDSTDSDSGSSFAPSYKTEVKSQSTAPAQSARNFRLGAVIPKTSASAPAPSSSTPLTLTAATSFPIKYSPPLSVSIPTTRQQQQHPMVSINGPQRTQSQQQQQQQQLKLASLFQNNRQQQATTIQPQQRKDQSPSLIQKASAINVPYNPQNNPSHAGKYFIN